MNLSAGATLLFFFQRTFLSVAAVRVRVCLCVYERKIYSTFDLISTLVLLLVKHL